VAGNGAVCNSTLQQHKHHQHNCNTTANTTGGVQHTRDALQRASAVAKVVARAAAAVAAIERAGLKCGVVTGGGSGTYRLEAGSGLFTEVQPGGCSPLLRAPAACFGWFGRVEVCGVGLC